MLERFIEKITDAEKARKQILAQINKRQREYKLAMAIIDAIVGRFLTKTTNRRIHTFVKQMPEMAGYTVTYNNEHSLQLTIWGNGFEWEDRFSIYLPGVITIDAMNEKNGRYLCELVQIQQLFDKYKKVDSYICRWNKILDDIEKLEQDTGPLWYYLKEQGDYRK
jgi:hypothetical protein